MLYGVRLDPPPRNCNRFRRAQERNPATPVGGFPGPPPSAPAVGDPATAEMEVWIPQPCRAVAGGGQPADAPDGFHFDDEDDDESQDGGKMDMDVDEQGEDGDQDEQSADHQKASKQEVSSAESDDEPVVLPPPPPSSRPR